MLIVVSACLYKRYAECLFCCKYEATLDYDARLTCIEKKIITDYRTYHAMS